MIHIDSFQIHKRLRANVQIAGNVAQLLFDQDGINGEQDIYKKGELLIRFRCQNGKLYAYWGALYPLLDANYIKTKPGGKIHFTASSQTNRFYLQ